MQIGSILVAAVAAYGYVYLLHCNNYWLLFMVLILDLLLLDMGVAITLSMALGFRRDQLISAVIRQADNTLSSKDEQRIFPRSYNPTTLSSRTCLSWMPNYNIIFWTALVLIQALLLGSLFLEIGDRTGSVWVRIIPLVVALVADAIFNFIVFRCFSRKWKEYIKKAPNILK